MFNDDHVPTIEELAAAVMDCKREVLEDMGTTKNSHGDRMPLTVRSFSELHDYVDANTYAGLCGAEPGQVDRSSWANEDAIDSINKMQDAINTWLASGEAYRERIAMPARVGNVNCLEGYRCPKCGYEESFQVSASMSVELVDNGISDSEGDTDYGDDAVTSCGECEWTGIMRDFYIPTQQQAFANFHPREPYSVCVNCGLVIVWNHLAQQYETKDDEVYDCTHGDALTSVKTPTGYPHQPAWLTLAEFRAKTAHLPDWLPITLDGQSPHSGVTESWYNTGITMVPTLDDLYGGEPPASLLLDIFDTFDTRQW